MKKLLLLTMMFAAFIMNQEAEAQTKCEKTIDVDGSVVKLTRGKSEISFFRKKVRKRRFIACPGGFGKSRGASVTCNILITNHEKQDVDVFLDGEYSGSIKAGEKAAFEKIKSYNEIFVLSADDKLTWNTKGECSCLYSFELKPAVIAEKKK